MLLISFTCEAKLRLWFKTSSGKKLVRLYPKKMSQEWWHMLEIPASQEEEISG
jgi:hypothetical protein